MTMRITANGEATEVGEGSTIAAFLESRELPAFRVAVEHNGKVVPKDRHLSTVLSAGDRLEIVTLVGGG